MKMGEYTDKEAGLTVNQATMSRVGAIPSSLTRDDSGNVIIKLSMDTTIPKLLFTEGNKNFKRTIAECTHNITHLIGG